MNNKNIYNESVEELYQQFKTSINGLTENEVTKRLATYGENKLQEAKKKSNIVLFFSQFNDLMIILLICALVFIFTKNGTIFRLYFEFFKVGICAFGGGLATIPFLSELADKTGWFTQLDLANMIAVSESTPGAMGVNMSTYVGFTTCNFIYSNWWISFIGSIISTLGLVSPSIIVIEVICLFLRKFKNNKYVDYVFYGLRAASIGLIIAAFYSILKVSIIDIDAFENTFELYKNMSFNIFLSNIAKSIDALINWKSLSIACVMGFFVFKYKKHPIFYIAISAIIGIILSL